MIISILGTAGAIVDFDNCLPRLDENFTPKYKFAKYLAKNIDKKDGEYKNATEFILNNYEDNFILLGTKCAIKFQKEILKDTIDSKNIEFIEILDNDLDDLFEKIFNILDKCNENIILDITHGFRHQPIMAIFASTMSQFLEHKELRIIFAKEIEREKIYEYVYLDQYIETTRLTLLLSGFIRTYNFIPVKGMKLIDAKSFEAFSKALLSNDMLGVTKSSKKLIDQVKTMLQNRDLAHIETLLLQVQEILQDFEDFDTLKDYEKYLTLTKMTTDKNYLIVALTYLFESLREYTSSRFSPLLTELNYKNDYFKNTDVMDTVCNFKRNYKDNAIQKKYPQIATKNRSSFGRVKTIYSEIRELRNSLAHINKDKEFEDIKNDINKMIFKVEKLYKDDILKHIII